MADEDANNPQRAAVLQVEERHIRVREFIRLRVQAALREAAVIAMAEPAEITFAEFVEWAGNEYTGAKYDIDIGTMHEVKRRRDLIEGSANDTKQGDRT